MRQDGAGDALGASSRDSADIRMLERSHTPEATAADSVPAATVASDLRIGESAGDWLGAPVDVASLGGGRSAVFDRMPKAILLFDSAGAPVGRVRHPPRAVRGHEPGETALGRLTELAATVAGGHGSLQRQRAERATRAPAESTTGPRRNAVGGR